MAAAAGDEKHAQGLGRLGGGYHGGGEQEARNECREPGGEPKAPIGREHCLNLRGN
jgi:hypothetical protein